MGKMQYTALEEFSVGGVDYKPGDEWKGSLGEAEAQVKAGKVRAAEVADTGTEPQQTPTPPQPPPSPEEDDGDEDDEDKEDDEQEPEKPPPKTAAKAAAKPRLTATRRRR